MGARWRDQRTQASQEQVRDAAESTRDPRVRRIIDAQARHVDIRIVGEFEDPAWVVLPPGSGLRKAERPSR